ncbi:ParA family protein [Shimia sp. R10_1]|uniref:ParA family protein n=1 Tax=Shimia sp. R10_1 TaxID=2821095 RepID=UPI001ADB28D2|nr:ParA family protein [Shimia sp. R10_1]MBO9474702.1 ParA family protein [Shimia sp. R10_1]
MKVISVINYKGGVGKTTVTANLAAELAWNGKRVLVVDMDAQASLTFSFITPSEWARDYNAGGTIKSWFDDFLSGQESDLKDIIQTPEIINDKVSINGGCVDAIYSHLALINVDLELATKLSGASLTQAKENFLKVHKRLADGLAGIQDKGYDVVLIDCPPNFNIVTKTAIVASDLILVPTRPDELSTLGIDYLVRSIDQLKLDFNDYANHSGGSIVEPIDPEILGVVFTMIQEYAGGPIQAQQVFMNRLSKSGYPPVFDAYIKRNDSLLSSAPAYGTPVVLEPTSNASHQSVVESFEEFCQEFQSKAGV